MEWINTNDKLPEVNKMVLVNCNQYEAVFCKNRKFERYNIPIVSWMLGDPFNEFDIEHGGYYKVTHWMELPIPPIADFI